MSDPYNGNPPVEIGAIGYQQSTLGLAINSYYIGSISAKSYPI